jgi:4-diphosphocytidyl-2-C-methyl-D-erythritol kinase
MYSWKVYGGLKLQLTKPNDDANILVRNLRKGNILEAGQLLVNDLESVIFRLSPSLKKLKEKLKSLNTIGVMASGSGPAVFGITQTKKEAEVIKRILSKRYARVFVVRTL